MKTKRVSMRGVSHRRISRRDIERILGHRICNLRVYKEAFIHKSMHKAMGASCERLELLGDAVINLVVADMLLERFPGASEGFVTRVRVKLVSGKQLAQFGRILELNKWVIMSNNARTMHVDHNDRILEDLFEAFIGALFQDTKSVSGIDACRTFIYRIIEKHVDLRKLTLEDNFKDILARHVQTTGIGNVEYELAEVSGPAHSRKFCTVVKLNGSEIGRATNKSKKTSEMQAAFFALRVLGVDLSSRIVGYGDGCSSSSTPCPVQQISCS